MADQPYSRPMHRELAQCTECKAWWSTAGDIVACPCGGTLELADLEKHRASLPYHPHVPQPPPPKKEP